MAVLSALQGFCVIGIIILIGYITAWAKVGGPTAQMVLQRFAFFVAMPCQMFTIISKENLSDVFTPAMAVAFSCAVLTAVIFLIANRLFLHLDLADSAVGTLVSMYMNANNIGLPVATYILDDPAAVTPIILMQQVIFTPIALTALDISTSGKASPDAIAKQLVRQPILIGVFLGILASFINRETSVFPVPQFLFDPLDIVSGAAVPLILCAFGMSLRSNRPLANRQALPAVATSAMLKCVIMPAIAFTVGSAMGLADSELYACVVLAALPTAQNVFNYAARYDAGTTFARDGILLSTVLSPLSIIVIAALLG
jgi:malonate transporter and related proteins